ncbi:MAG: hypothetical protein IKG18_02860 [Atopobiaceae bacterium]|nr:hypothetical protein [Atopobiaceae bacterium]MBR3313060.1 hypothetical protein [Atopobiaceae bacterium]
MLWQVDSSRAAATSTVSSSGALVPLDERHHESVEVHEVYRLLAAPQVWRPW